MLIMSEFSILSIDGWKVISLYSEKILSTKNHQLIPLAYKLVVL